MPDVTPNVTPDKGANSEPGTAPDKGATSENRRPTDERDRPRAARPGGVVPLGEAALTGEKERTPSTEPRGTTTAAAGPTPLGSDTGAGTATRTPAAGAVSGTTRHRDTEDRGTADRGTADRGKGVGGDGVDTVAGPGRAATTAGSGTPLADRTSADRAPAADGNGGHGASLLPIEECDRIASRMRHAVVGFVDGPQDAVAEADQVLEELATRFTDAVDRRRRTLRGTWQSTAPESGGKDRAATAATAADTEQLRLALRDYRELTERLLHL